MKGRKKIMTKGTGGILGHLFPKEGKALTK